MDTRVGLDNPMFVGRVRQDRRTSSYVRRTDYNTPLRTRPVGGEIQPVLTRKVQTQASSIASYASVSIPVTTAPPLQRKAVAPAPPTPAGSNVGKRRMPSLKVVVLYGMSGLLFIGGGLTVVSSLLTDKHITAQVQNLSQTQTSRSGNQKDAPAIIPAADKPAANDLSKYTVAPDRPRFVTIASQNQKAKILPMGVNAKGQLSSPSNIYDIGWYTGSSLPGEPGAMVLDGHKSTWKANGTFYGLKKLKPGDKVSVERGDGKVFTYEVIKSQLYDYDKVDMQSAVKSVDPARPGLNLITCEGNVIPGTNEFDKRIIVYAALE